MSELTFNRILGREIRSTSGTDLGVPTDRLAVDALRAGDTREAQRLLTYLVEESGRIFKLFSIWLDSLVEYGVDKFDDFDRIRERLTETIGSPPPIPDDENAIAPRERTAASEALDGGDPDGFATALRALREAQWKVHDAQTDWAWGLLTAFQERLGEERMGEVFRDTQESWLKDRYATANQLSPREIFELTIEGMRGHYCGTDRSGDIDVEEDDEKWVMSFAPCGTGGRMRRGDLDRGQQPRTDPPHSFADVEGAYDWTWNKEGVCLYCAHCAVVNEIIPIEQLGTPMRVTEYPKSAEDACTWTVYKSPDLVPDWAYERVGKTPPKRDA